MLRDSELMEERDYRTYLDLFANMSNFMVPCSLMHRTSDLVRINMLSRPCHTSYNRKSPT
jgi:hypothetical protein